MRLSADLPSGAGDSSWAVSAEARGAGAGSAVAWVIPSLLFIGAFAFLIAFLIGGAAGDLQSAVALAITAIPFLIVAIEAPDRLLHPLSIFGFTMILGVAGQTVYLTHGRPAALPELLSGLSPDILNKGLIVAAVGMLALAFGYFAASSRREVERPGRLLTRAMQLDLVRPSPQRAFVFGCVVCVISVIAFALYAPKVGIHGVNGLLTSQKRFVVQEGHVLVYGYYRALFFATGPLFVLLVYVMIRNRISMFSRIGVLAGVSLLLTVFYATVTSSRSELFASVAVAVFVSIALRRREPRAKSIILALLVAVLGLVFLGGLRSAASSQASSASPNQSFSSAIDTGAMLENTVGNGSWGDIGPMSVLMHRVPGAYPYQYGKTLVSIVWAPVPRTLWPAKPPVRIGPVIGPKVFGYSEQRITGDPVGILGELWLNGSVFAVVVGMALLGAVIRWIERLYRLVGQTDGLSAIPYGIFVVGACLQLPITDLTGVLGAVLENLIVVALLLWVVRQPASGRLATKST
jgi:oligosaccharide repeat unit polymerase